jgi:hypothetical protein
VRARLRKLLPYAVPSLAFLGIVLALYWRVWTPIAGAKSAFGWDAAHEYWGDLQFVLDSLKDGELPLWNPYDRLGYPLHADPQAGVLYPPNWLLLVVGAIAGAKSWLVTLKIILHTWLAGVGMYAFCRRRGLPPFACYAAGIILVLGYPHSHAMFSAINWGIAWAPWMLLAVDAWAERPTVGRAAAVALTFGVCQLAGAPAAFWYSLLVAAPYGVWAIVHHRARAEDRRAYLKAAARTTAIAAGLFLAMVAGQFLATGQLVEHTVRDTRDLEFIGASVFFPENIIGLFIPRYPGPNYVGEQGYLTYVVIFSIAILMTVRPTPRTLVLLGIAVAGALLAMGNQAGFLPNMASAAGPFGFFRRAHRYLFVTLIALAPLGAEGLAALVAYQGRGLRRRVGRAVLFVGALGLLAFGSAFLHSPLPDAKVPAYRDAFIHALLALVVSAWVVFGAVTFRGRLRATFAVLCVVVLGADLWVARFPAIERNFYPPPATLHDAEIGKLPGVPLEARIYDREHFGFRPGIRLKIRDLGGYEGDPLALSRYARFLKAAQAQPKLLGLAGVRYLTEGPTSYSKKQLLPTKDLRPVSKGVFEIPDARPTVMWVGGWRLVENAEAALAALRAAPAPVAILEEDNAPAGLLTAPGQDQAMVPGRVVELTRNRMVVEVEAPAHGVVVVHEAYYPGWKATVDGKPTPVFPANSAFRGIAVGPGAHRIELRYPARAYVLLAPVSILAVAAAVSLILLERKRRRRGSP